MEHQLPTAACKLLLETPDEVALAIACALDRPLDLVRLALACRRYRLKTVADSTRSAGACARAPTMWSITEEAARRWIALQPSAQRRWVPAMPGPARFGTNWKQRMHALVQLRAPPAFARRHPNIELSDGGTCARRISNASMMYTSTAASAAVMRAGRHFAEFSVEADTHDPWYFTSFFVSVSD